MFRALLDVSKMSATLVEPEDIISHVRFMRGIIMSLGEGVEVIILPNMSQDLPSNGAKSLSWSFVFPWHASHGSPNVLSCLQQKDRCDIALLQANSTTTPISSDKLMPIIGGRCS